MKSTRTRSLTIIGLIVSAATIGAYLSIGSQNRVILFALVGVIATLAIGLLPFRTVCPLLVTVTIFTYFSAPIGGFHLRPDMALLPAALMSCVMSGYLPRLTKWLANPVIQLLSSFVVLNIIGSLFESPNLRKSEAIAAWFAIDLLILLVILAYYSERGIALERRLFGAAWIAVGFGVFSWLANAFKFHVIGTSYTSQTGLRAYGISYEPNILAGIGAIWLVIILGRRRLLSRSERVFCLLALAVIPLTSTRTALLAVAIGMAISCLAGGRGGVVFTRLARLTLVFMAFLLAAAPFFRSAAGPLVDKLLNLNFHNQTAEFRFTTWTVALHDLSGVHWFLGLGTNSFGMRHIDPTSIYLPMPNRGYLGNLPLTWIYDVGLPGFGLMIAAAVKLVNIRKAPAERLRALAVLVTFAVIATGTNPFFFSYYWLFIGVAIIGLDRPRHLTKDLTEESPVREIFR